MFNSAKNQSEPGVLLDISFNALVHSSIEEVCSHNSFELLLNLGMYGLCKNHHVQLGHVLLLNTNRKSYMGRKNACKL